MTRGAPAELAEETPMTRQQLNLALRPLVQELIDNGETDPKFIIRTACYAMGFKPQTWMEAIARARLPSGPLTTTTHRK